MPRVVYVGPHDEVDVPLFRIRGARPGVPVKVTAEQRADLLEQPDNWADPDAQPVADEVPNAAPLEG